MEKPYRYRKKLVRTGNAKYVLIPLSWLEKQAKRLKVKVLKFVDLLIYDEYLELRPSKE